MLSDECREQAFLRIYEISVSRRIQRAKPDLRLGVGPIFRFPVYGREYTNRNIAYCLFFCYNGQKERRDPMQALSVMIKPSSGNCNMQCKYCFYHDEMEKRKQSLYGYMSDETLKNVIRKTMSQVDRQITYAYQGGEPTLRGLDFFRKAVAYQKQYNHKHIQVSNALQTNGFALNEEWCRFLKENNFLVGVSVDGTKEIHDTYRRQAGNRNATYDRVAANIALLDQYGVDYNILTVVTQDMTGSAKEIYRDYQEKGWNFQQYIECLDPLDAPFGQSPYSLQPMAYGRFLTDLFDVWYTDLQKGRQPYIRRFENYVGILAGYPVEACDQRGECGIQLVVEADGSAYPCDFYMLDEYRLGNFNTDRVPGMDLQREKIGFIQRSRKRAAKCGSCPYAGLCRDGCQRSRVYLPEEDAYISYFCEGYRYFFDHCLERMELVARNIRRQNRH